MKVSHAFVLSILLFCATYAFAEEKSTAAYSFILDKKVVDPDAIRMRGESLSPGDIVLIGDIPIRLEEPELYMLTRAGNLLTRTWVGGRKAVVGCVIPDEDDPQNPYDRPNPIMEMDAAALKALCGVSIRAWPAGIEKQLARLDFQKVAISVSGSAIREKIPPLPTGLRALAVRAEGAWNPGDLSGFSRLKNLKVLDLRTARIASFDLSLLKGLSLKYLGLPRTQSVHFSKAVPDFGGLEVLDLSRVSSFGNGAWMGRLKSLRILRANWLESEFEDDIGTLDPLAFAALEGLSKLESLNAMGRNIQSLPAAGMRSLKWFQFSHGRVNKDMMLRFTTANPQATGGRTGREVVEEPFKPMPIKVTPIREVSGPLKRADRIRVRSGGTCHRRVETEKLIFESRDAVVIASLSAKLLNEESSGGGPSCMCCGDPSFEFFSGETLVGTVGFHHGETIRVLLNDGKAESLYCVDFLEEENARFLVNWLAEHQYPSLREEWEYTNRKRAAGRKMEMRYDAIKPQAIRDEWTQIGKLSMEERRTDVRDWTAIWQRAVPDDRARGITFLRLFGCGDGHWMSYTWYDEELVKERIPSVPLVALNAVLEESSLSLETDEGRGALRWIFGEEHASILRSSDALLKRFAAGGLTNRKARNRWQCMTVLRDLGNPAAVELLREVLKTGANRTLLPNEDFEEPDGTIRFQEGAINLPEGTSDQIVAALCLAQMGDKESEIEIQRIREGLSGETKTLWEDYVKKEIKRTGW